MIPPAKDQPSDSSAPWPGSLDPRCNTAATARQLLDKAQRHFKAEQFAEAIPILTLAVESFPDEEKHWKQLVWSAWKTDQHQLTADLAKRGIRHHPKSSWLWGQLGSALVKIDRLDEAETAIKNGLGFDAKADWLWRCLAAIHRKRKTPVKEIEVLEKLRELGLANSRDLNELGTAYFSSKQFTRALDCYRLSAAAGQDYSPYFNLGLVYNRPEVAQKLDGADAFRRALVLAPDHLRAKTYLADIKSKLAPLAARAREQMPKLERSNKFSENYTSPFEALPIEESSKSSELDRSVLRAAKNKLLAEIQFNDGKIPWLDNRVLEKSTAEKLVDELNDPMRARYHWCIYENKPLLRFLTRGDLVHFIYSDAYFPLATLELLDKDQGFSKFISKALASQDNAVLTKAIEQRLLALIEVLLDGRRWVLPEDEEACLEGAHRRIADLVEQIATLATQSQSRRVTFEEIKSLFGLYQLPDLLNLLPPAFSAEMTAFVKHLRQLAISCFNHHDDAELANEILKLCRQFQCTDARLLDRLEKDLQAMGQEAADSRVHSFAALIRPNLSAQIGNGRITYGQASIEASQIEAVSWGVIIHRVNGSETNRAFSLVVRDAHTCLAVEWNTPGIVAAFKGLFRPTGEKVPVTELASSEQEAHYNKMIDAVQHHLVPTLVAKLVKRLRSGESVSIGPCSLTQLGIGFKTGLIFHKSHFLPWTDVKATMSGGQLEIASLTNPATKASMPLKETDNAAILPVIYFAMQKPPA